MNSQIQPESPSNLDRWLSKSWLGYGLICFCSTFLCFALSDVSQATGLGSGKLMNALAPLATFSALFCFAGAVASRVAIRVLDRDLEITPRTKYSRIAGVIFAVSLLLSTFSLLVGAYRQTVTADSIQTYDLLGGKLVVTVPSSLAVDPNVGQTRNTLGLINQIDDISVVITARSASDIVESDITEFGKAEAARAMQHLNNAKLVESSSREFEGATVVRHRIRHEVEGLFGELLIEHQQLGDYWAAIRCGCTPGKFQEFQDQFDLISQSIRRSNRSQ